MIETGYALRNRSWPCTQENRVSIAQKKKANPEGLA